MSVEEARQNLLDAAERFVGVRRDAVVIVARGQVEVIRPAPTAGPPPEGLSAAETAIIAALTDTPVSAKKLARLTNRTYSSYFRGQVALLVEANLVRRTRKGYSRPPAR